MMKAATAAPTISAKPETPTPMPTLAPVLREEDDEVGVPVAESVDDARDVVLEVGSCDVRADRLVLALPVLSGVDIVGVLRDPDGVELGDCAVVVPSNSSALFTSDGRSWYH